MLTSKMSNMIFIGPLGGGKVPTNGASVKNYHIVNFLRKHGEQPLIFDTENWKEDPFLLIRLFLTLIFKRKSQYVLSANSTSAFKILKVMNFLKIRNVIYWVIGGSLADKIQEEIYDPLVYKNIRLIIVEGDNMRRKMLECGIHNVIKVPNFKAISYIPRKTYSFSPVVKFVFLSRIVPQKGCDYIIEAVKKMSDIGYSEYFIVDFYGPIDSDYKNSFQEKISKLKNVTYKGFLDLRKTENYDVLVNYDVMLFPTYWSGEGFPGIVIDALVAGLPIIATDWNMNQEVVVDGKTGFLIPPHDIDSLVTSMKMCIDRKELVKKMSSFCQKQCLLFDTKNVLNDNLYESKINNI